MSVYISESVNLDKRGYCESDIPVSFMKDFCFNLSAKTIAVKGMLLT